MVTALMAVAWAGRPTSLSVAVVDATTGAPIRAAEVQFADDPGRSPVDVADGLWTGSALYLSDESELRFVPKLTVEVRAVAAGYVAAGTVHTVGRREDRLTIALEPLVWAAPTVDSPESRTYEAYQAWVETSAAVVERFEADTLLARARARVRVGALAEAWLASVDDSGGDRALAQVVCLSTATPAERCE